MNVAVFSVPSYEAVQKVYGEAKGHLGEILSAFEFWDKQAVCSLFPLRCSRAGNRQAGRGLARVMAI